MALVVRRANLAKDDHAIIELQRKALTRQSDRRRFEWLYLEHPFGEPLVWVLEDSESGEVIGTASAFPRSLWLEGGKGVGWVLGDFCISDSFRSLGPALQLQRACLAGVGEGPHPIWYDFPSSKMLSIYKRLNILPSGVLTRFAKPLRVDRKLQAWGSKGTIVHHCLSGIGNALLKLSHSRPSRRKGMTFQYHEGECDEEFTELSETIGGMLGNRLERTASYLNWRYCQNPIYRCELVSARLDGKLKGYGVFAEIDDDATIVDLFGVPDQDVIHGLLDQITTLVRDRGKQTLSVSIAEGHIWIEFLQSFGFKPRDTDPVIVNMPNTKLTLDDRKSEGHHIPLLLMQGDRDV